MSKLYHYTTRDNLRSIIKVRTIKLSTYGLENPRWHAVWASLNPTWERTSVSICLTSGTGRRIIITPETTTGLYWRIGVRPGDVPLTFNQYLKKSGLPSEIRKL